MGCLGSDATHPEVQLTPLGEAVRQAWEQTPEKQATPGISRGELLMKNECLERGFPLIHIQKEPIGPYWKPERQRFDACANGSLLILAPWQLDQMGTVANVPSNTDYSRFHNLNNLATEVCDFSGNAKIVRLNNG